MSSQVLTPPENVPLPDKPIVLEDPSEYRPEHKKKEDFRNFNIHTTPAHVVETYRQMHTQQTLEYVRQKMEFWGMSFLQHALYTYIQLLDIYIPTANMYKLSYHNC